MARATNEPSYIIEPVRGVHQSPQRSLMIMSRLQGFDPTKIVDQQTGESTDISNFDYDPGTHVGARYVGRLPDGGGAPDRPDVFPAAAAPGVLDEKVTWNSPNRNKDTASRRTMKGGDPFAGFGGQ